MYGDMWRESKKPQDNPEALVATATLGRLDFPPTAGLNPAGSGANQQVCELFRGWDTGRYSSAVLPGPISKAEQYQHL